MRSKVSLTFEIDRPDIAADELYRGVADCLEPEAGGVGVLFCCSDIDRAALDRLTSLLREKLPFELIGCNAIATMEHTEGFHELAATLLVLTADDCRFSVRASEPVAPDNVAGQVEAVYSAAAAALPEKPGLVVALPPYMLNIMLDEYTNAFNAVAPGVPVVGGLPSYNGGRDLNRTILNGESFSDRMVMVAISGNIKPVFAVQTITSPPLERKRKVTSANGNVIYRVGGQRFTDYLREIGMPVEKLSDGNNTVTFVSNPILVEHTGGHGGESSSFLRTLHEINIEDGSGTAIGGIPEDATISVCPLNRAEITNAAIEGAGLLNARMDAGSADGYRYSTVLAVSCIGRYLVMAPNSSAEIDRLLSGFREGLVLGGFYSYGEIGPYPGKEGSVTFAHNESMVLCAF